MWNRSLNLHKYLLAKQCVSRYLAVTFRQHVPKCMWVCPVIIQRWESRDTHHLYFSGIFLVNKNLRLHSSDVAFDTVLCFWPFEFWVLCFNFWFFIFLGKQIDTNLYRFCIVIFSHTVFTYICIHYKCQGALEYWIKNTWRVNHLILVQTFRTKTNHQWKSTKYVSRYLR